MPLAVWLFYVWEVGSYFCLQNKQGQIQKRSCLFLELSLENFFEMNNRIGGSSPAYKIVQYFLHKNN